MTENSEINNIITIASKEFNDNIKSKRFLVIGIFYIGMALLMAGIVTFIYYGYVNMANEPPSEMHKIQAQYFLESFKPDMVISNLNILNIALALLAIVVSADAISIEKKDRTIYQLMSKPVERNSVIIGKFLGNLAVVSSIFFIGALLGYVLTAILTGRYPGMGEIPTVIAALLSMVLLLSVYVAIGILISAVTKNPFISIVGSMLVWMGLWFSSTIGHVIGDTTVYNKEIFIIGDTFDYYPIYAKILIWIDPLSHGILPQILDSSIAQVAAGLPLWGNIVALLAYTCILLIAAIVLFSYQDL
jgi:ABC-type transport system involved in multi-copper enzyme maturation permease subunit